VALTLYVYKASSNGKLALGLASMAGFGPAIVASLFGGVLAERHCHKLIVFWGQVCRSVVLAVMMVTVDVHFLIMLIAVSSFAEWLVIPARQAAISECVMARAIPFANSLVLSSLSVARLGAPLLGASALAQDGRIEVVLAVDCVLSSLAALLVLFVSAPCVENREHSRLSWFEENALAWTYLRRRPDLLRLVLIVFLSGMAYPAIPTLLRPHIQEVVSGDEMDFGTLRAVIELGGVVSLVFGHWAVRGFGLGRTVWWSFAIEALLLSVWSQTSQLSSSACVLMLWGAAVNVNVSSQASYIHMRVSSAYHGRTFAFLSLLMLSGHLLGSSSIALAGDAFSARGVALGTGVLYLVGIGIVSKCSSARHPINSFLVSRNSV
jgi:predicted MFS family arabinose efflux permease